MESASAMDPNRILRNNFNLLNLSIGFVDDITNQNFKNIF